MKNFLTLMTGVALLAATPALAQDAAPAVEAQVGMKVIGPNGGEVGSVDSVSDGVVVVDTGKNKAALATDAFAEADNGLSIMMTKVDLDTAVEKAAADARAQLLASLTPGTEVKTVTGAAVIGTIKESDAEYVTVEHNGLPVKLPVAAFMAKADGVSITMTEDQFKAALAGTQ
ncbi:preprotein translocase subunit YajC [Parasphingorhabdus halotolerans]|uniref:Preprotein translocase subunit YajC n=1 Tax=Parasphingorhabdus halotolerans TaxID=2725558 RepID=A0A6H2DQD3_9SPHN|nr:preprotein translocase subunit YajC [Parasphingorhabdus halotolerans]QJB69971.1 preprotein translocase subunit YajC [Parasphingorhabdus halotolerans]